MENLRGNCWYKTLEEDTSIDFDYTLKWDKGQRPDGVGKNTVMNSFTSI